MYCVLWNLMIWIRTSWAAYIRACVLWPAAGHDIFDRTSGINNMHFCLTQRTNHPFKILGIFTPGLSLHSGIIIRSIWGIISASLHLHTVKEFLWICELMGHFSVSFENSLQRCMLICFYYYYFTFGVSRQSMYTYMHGMALGRNT